MERTAEEPTRETVAEREWVIRELDQDGAVMERIPDGGIELFHRDVLPDDVTVGDRFRVIAQVDRREAGADLPDAAREALNNLS